MIIKKVVYSSLLLMVTALVNTELAYAHSLRPEIVTTNDTDHFMLSYSLTNSPNSMSDMKYVVYVGNSITFEIPPSEYLYLFACLEDVDTPNYCEQIDNYTLLGSFHQTSDDKTGDEEHTIYWAPVAYNKSLPAIDVGNDTFVCTHKKGKSMSTKEPVIEATITDSVSGVFTANSMTCTHIED